MKLSKNFSLEEFTTSSTAKKNAISNNPSKKQIAHIKLFCLHILQPLRDHFKKPIKISSGYRSKALNSAVGGVSNSDHRHLKRSCAVDFKINGIPLKEVYNHITKNKKKYTYKQCIYEFGRWIHLSFEAPIQEDLIAKKIAGKTKYLNDETHYV